MSLNYRDPTTGNLTRLDGVTMDSSPTSGSGNAVSSGGVYTALGNKMDKSGGTFTGTVYVGNSDTRVTISPGEIRIGESSNDDDMPYTLRFGDGYNVYLRESNDDDLDIYASNTIYLKGDVTVDAGKSLYGDIHARNLVLPINPSTTPTTNGSIWITT